MNCSTCKGPLVKSGYGGYIHENDVDDGHTPTVLGGYYLGDGPAPNDPPDLIHTIVVISVACTPEQVAEILDHLDPPTIPYFDGLVRIATDEPAAQAVVDFLDDDKPLPGARR